MTKVNVLARALGKAPIPGPLTKQEANRLIILFSTAMDMKAVAEQKAKTAAARSRSINGHGTAMATS
jgi:hypothetical protein